MILLHCVLSGSNITYFLDRQLVINKQPVEVGGYNRSVMPLYILGGTRNTMFLPIRELVLLVQIRNLKGNLAIIYFLARIEACKFLMN